MVHSQKKSQRFATTLSSVAHCKLKLEQSFWATTRYLQVITPNIE